MDLDARRGDERLLVQCKQWRTRRVPVEKARELWGIVASESASGAALVTCGNFTTDAESFAQGKNLQLVDGEKLLVSDQAGPVPSRDRTRRDNCTGRGESHCERGDCALSTMRQSDGVAYRAHRLRGATSI